MKFILIAGIAVLGMGVAVTYIPSVTEVNKIETEEIIKEIEVEVEVDALSQAQAQLDAANLILDEEESKLLGEIEELQKQEAEKEARLEQIRETRTSF